MNDTESHLKEKDVGFEEHADPELEPLNILENKSMVLSVNSNDLVKTNNNGEERVRPTEKLSIEVENPNYGMTTKAISIQVSYFFLKVM